MGYHNGFEWKSKTEILGFPLVHVTVGRNPKTGAVLVSKGIIAIGQVAIGTYVFAQMGWGEHVCCMRYCDPLAKEYFLNIWHLVKHVIAFIAPKIIAPKIVKFTPL